MIRSVAAAICLICPSFQTGGSSDDTPPAVRVEKQLNGHTFSLPTGFEIIQVAGPPLVDRPITATFDEQGRLYVTDSSGSNDKVDKQLAEKPHRVVRLEDSDGDGSFDRSTVFADKLMFPEGSLWFDGSLYVSAPPSIWKLTDTDGDGVADRRDEWFAGKTLTGCANDLHGPYLGPDGWIYWCKGAFARQTYELDGKSLRVIPGLPLNIVGKEVPVTGSGAKAGNEKDRSPSGPTWSTRASHIFRCRPDGTGLEVVMTGGMDNPVDVVFTPGGERIFTTTFLQNPAGGLRDGLFHAVYGGIYGKDHDPIHEPQHRWTGPELMPVLSHLGAAAPCGLTTYESNVFGDEFRDNIFACLFNMHKITRHVLEQHGATFQSHDSDFLVSSNLDFHPTDILDDADGSLIVVDTGGWYKLCCPTSQLHKPDVLGAVYRIRRKNAPRVQHPRGDEIQWSRLAATDLAPFLADGRPAVRERAVQTLAKRGTEAIDVLSTVAAGGYSQVIRPEQGRALPRDDTDEAARRAVWALTRIDHPNARRGVRTALDHPNESVRQAAIQSISLRRDDEAVPMLLRTLDRGTAQNVRAAAEALGRIGDRAAVMPILRALGRLRNFTSRTEVSEHDRFLVHSLTYALIELNDQQGTVHGLVSSNSNVRRAALIALDQIDDNARNAAGLLDDSDKNIRAAAEWIVSRHPEWGNELSGYLSRRLAKIEAGDADHLVLTRQLAQFARTPAIQEFLAASAQSGAVPNSNAGNRTHVQQVAFESMRLSGLKELPKAWVAAVVDVVSHEDPDLIAAAISVARAVPPTKDSGPTLAAALVKVANNKQLPAATRLNALVAVPGGLAAVDSALFDFLRQNLGPDSPVANRSAAVEVVAKAKLNSDQLGSLADVLASAGPLEVDRLLGAFEQSSDASIGLKLVTALEQAPSLSALRPDAIQRSIAKCGPAVQDQAQRLYAAIHVDLAKQKDRLEDLLLSVSKGGDIRRGQAVFMSNKAACASCHQLGYLGGNIGPDLTRIGGIRNERDLLESIAFPNASFVRSYESIVVATREGKVISGVIRKDAADELILAINATETARIAREEIEEIRPGTVSVMPSGLDQQLSREELADLIAFLKAAK